MVNCPKCGKKMKIGGYQFDQPLYNCDSCGVDLYRPPKKPYRPYPSTKKATKKTRSRKTKGKK